MKIDVVCSGQSHPVWSRLEEWVEINQQEHEIQLVSTVNSLTGGELLFLISCHEIVRSEVSEQYGAALVIHASDLPEGRGWSPHIWQVLEGKKDIVVSLLEVAEEVDSGRIWKKLEFSLGGHELSHEIDQKLFDTELQLLDFAVSEYGTIVPVEQDSNAATYYRKRTPAHSVVAPETTFAEQFDLLRVANPIRYPAYIDYRGYRYKIVLEKVASLSELDKA